MSGSSEKWRSNWAHVVLKMIGEEIRNVSLVSTYEDCEQRQQGQ